jgi:hypothetical protein
MGMEQLQVTEKISTKHLISSKTYKSGVQKKTRNSAHLTSCLILPKPVQ